MSALGRVRTTGLATDLNLGYMRSLEGRYPPLKGRRAGAGVPLLCPALESPT